MKLAIAFLLLALIAIPNLMPKALAYGSFDVVAVAVMQHKQSIDELVSAVNTLISRVDRLESKVSHLESESHSH